MRPQFFEDQVATSRQRFIRALTLASLTVPFAVFGHWLAGGHMPHVIGMVIAFVTVIYAVALLRARHLSLQVLVPLNAGVQFVLHTVFTWFGTVNTGGMSEHPHALHLSANEQWQLLAGSGSQTLSMSGHGWDMALWHCIVAIVVTVLAGYSRDILAVLAILGTQIFGIFWLPRLQPFGFPAKIRQSRAPQNLYIFSESFSWSSMSWRGPPTLAR